MPGRCLHRRSQLRHIGQTLHSNAGISNMVCEEFAEVALLCNASAERRLPRLSQLHCETKGPSLE